jgi:hypothetical protein
LGIASKSTVDALQKIYHETPSELLIPRSPNKLFTSQSQPSVPVANGQNGADSSPGKAEQVGHCNLS